MVGCPEGAGALDEEGADLLEDGARLGGGEREKKGGQGLAEVRGPEVSPYGGASEEGEGLSEEVPDAEGEGTLAGVWEAVGEEVQVEEDEVAGAV